MRRLRLPLALFAVLVLQRSLFDDVRVAGVHPDVLLLFAVALGLVGGSERGAVQAFMVGLLADLFAQTPFGLSAFTYALVAYAVGVVQTGLLRAAWWIPPVTAAVGSAGGIVLFALAGAVIGRTHFVRPDLWVVVLAVAVMNCALSLPAVRLAAWAVPAALQDDAYVR